MRNILILASLFLAYHFFTNDMNSFNNIVHQQVSALASNHILPL
jgi:hypothetical protein